MRHGRLDSIIGSFQFQESIFPVIIRSEIPTQHIKGLSTMYCTVIVLHVHSITEFQ